MRPEHRIVFVGGPGGGKTSVLREFAAQGHPVAADSARAIIRARRSRSLSPRPAPLEFARAVLQEDIRQHREHAGTPGLVFFERGVVDALGMLHAIDALPEHALQAALAAHRYRQPVLLFPPWAEIYVTDTERDQSYAESEQICDAVRAWYRRCGYAVVEVPRLGVAERCAFVMETLAASRDGISEDRLRGDSDPHHRAARGAR